MISRTSITASSPVAAVAVVVSLLLSAANIAAVAAVEPAHVLSERFSQLVQLKEGHSVDDSMPSIVEAIEAVLPAMKGAFDDEDGGVEVMSVKIVSVEGVVVRRRRQRRRNLRGDVVVNGIDDGEEGEGGEHISLDEVNSHPEDFDLEVVEGIVMDDSGTAIRTLPSRQLLSRRLKIDFTLSATCFGCRKRNFSDSSHNRRKLGAEPLEIVKDNQSKLIVESGNPAVESVGELTSRPMSVAGEAQVDAVNAKVDLAFAQDVVSALETKVAEWRERMVEAESASEKADEEASKQMEGVDGGPEEEAALALEKAADEDAEKVVEARNHEMVVASIGF